MAIVIILMIAFWFLVNLVEGFPIALAILMTIFGSLHCLVSIIQAIVKAYNKSHQPKKTGNPIVDDAIDRINRFR